MNTVNAPYKFKAIYYKFLSRGLQCAGTLYLPIGVNNPAVIIMAHGFAGIRKFRLDAFAERFAEAGVAAFFFDYRNFGDSEGEPRHWVDPKRHQEDYYEALKYVKTLPEVDANRVILWGSSLSGGHVLTIAGKQPSIAAVIAQVPHVSGIPTMLAMKPINLLTAIGAALRDILGNSLFKSHYYSPVIGKPGTFAAMNSEGSWEGYMQFVTPDAQWENKVLARTFLKIPMYSPSHSVHRIQVPSLVIAGSKDTVTPAATTKRAATKIKDVEFHMLDCTHFEPYTGDCFEVNISIQLEFLNKHGFCPQS
ncbi:alpha/beta hydrolase [Bacillus sp. EAC]|uniref:alpha/beta hydrolase n=1 Tax=Bacillus sp. EAC TaxID=1978338 RepID=UPI001C4E80F1|nr:alpha/beta fold hydrolase [Bacillus sp. EAC]